ncbi:MAG TPA: membrane protein insertase YidC [Acidobacteriaceae bacterium]|nr:membrane protein insertase YidC [Acidobacteriaceae bacterium]
MAEIRNPNQPGGGGQDSRTLLIFSIVFVLIFLGLQYFSPKKNKPAEHPAEVASSSAPKSSPAAPASAAPVATSPDAAKTVPESAVAASAETTTVVENELYKITFSNRGGQVVSWILKKYKDDSGKPLDLVNSMAAAKMGYPLSIWTYDANLRDRFAQALFIPSATGTLNAPATLTFTYSGNGLEVKKVFTFDSTYVLHAELTATEHGNPIPAMLAWPGGFGDQETLPDYATSQFDTMQNGKSENQAAKKISGGGTLPGPFQWAGVSDQYFAAIFLPDMPSQALLVSLHDSINVPRHGKADATDPASVLGAAMGSNSGQTSMRLFAGPKVLEVLAAIRAMENGAQTGPNLEPVVDFGFTGIIAKPLFLALRWVHEHIVSNWGWAILVLTLVINLAMLPTRIQMMKSALKMQRIQPEMNAIKEKYKKYKTTDPRRADMNKEMFDLQKREGVNMFGGCLPMLVQWPLLFAFYRMLLHTIELRQAPWLWLHNLAAPDPLHILPVFFIVTMFLVQYLTPSPGMDPAQQKMMAFTMPVFFGFMTWNLSSGLALYWAFGNVINVIQQAIMNRTGMGKQMREIAAKRAAKRSGLRPPSRKPAIEPRRRPETGG